MLIYNDKVNNKNDPSIRCSRCSRCLHVHIVLSKYQICVAGVAGVADVWGRKVKGQVYIYMYIYGPKSENVDNLMSEIDHHQGFCV